MFLDLFDPLECYILSYGCFIWTFWFFFVSFSFKLVCYIQVSILKLHTMKILFTVYWLSYYPNIMIVDVIFKQKYKSYCAFINNNNQSIVKYAVQNALWMHNFGWHHEGLCLKFLTRSHIWDRIMWLYFVSLSPFLYNFPDLDLHYSNILGANHWVNSTSYWKCEWVVQQ